MTLSMCYTPQKWANLYRYIFWYRNTYMLRKLCYQNSFWSYFTLVHVLQWTTAKCQLPARGRAPPYSQHPPTCPFSSRVNKTLLTLHNLHHILFVSPPSMFTLSSRAARSLSSASCFRCKACTPAKSCPWSSVERAVSFSWIHALVSSASLQQ